MSKMRRFLTVLLAVAFAGSLGLVGSGQASAHQLTARHHGAPAVSVFAAGLNNPRGLTFGPDRNLYVAEGGLGGTHSTVGLCPQAAGAALVEPFPAFLASGKAFMRGLQRVKRPADLELDLGHVRQRDRLTGRVGPHPAHGKALSQQ